MLSIVGTTTQDMFNVSTSTGLSVFKILANGNVGIGTSSPGSMFSITGAPGNTNLFTIASSSGLVVLSLLANGNFGIGTTTPGSTFSVTAKAGKQVLQIASSSGANMFSIDSYSRLFVGQSTSGNFFVNSGTTTMDLVDDANIIAIGSGAAQNSMTSSPYTDNVAIGSFSLFGSSSLRSSGVQNVAIGAYAGQRNFGDYNTFIGDFVGSSNTSGSSNVFIGRNWNYSAGGNNTTGYSNIFIGGGAGEYNTSGNSNIAQGEYALFMNATGTNNVVTGNNALSSSRNSSSTAMGDSALADILTGGNTAFGFQAGVGDGVTTNQRSTVDSFVTFLGFQTSRDQSIAQATQLNNITAIGKNARVALSNSIVLGGTSTDAVNVGIGTTSPNALLTIRSQSGVASNSLLIASSTGVTMLGLFASGNLSLGTSTASSRLDIYRDTSSSDVDLFRLLSDVGGSGNVKFRIDSDGDVFTDGGTTIGNPADVAENYSAEESLQPGTVVALASSTEDWNVDTSSYSMSRVRTAKKGDTTFGIVSTQPGVLLSGNTKNAVPVALSGRVPVKVSNENGVVHRGDYLTLSTSTPGYAMKMTENGYSVGRALSDAPQTATSTVLVFVENRYQLASLYSVAEIGAATAPTVSVFSRIQNLISSGVSVSKEFVTTKFSSVVAYIDTLYVGEVHADTVCIGHTCVTETQLQKLLDQSNQVSNNAPYIPGATSTPTEQIPLLQTTPSMGTTTDATSTSPSTLEATSTNAAPFLDPPTTSGVDATSTQATSTTS
jgi:hypothetical protein